METRMCNCKGLPQEIVFSCGSKKSGGKVAIFDDSLREALGPVSENWFEEECVRRSKEAKVPSSQQFSMDRKKEIDFPCVSTPGSDRKFPPSLSHVLRSQEESPILSTFSWLQPCLGNSPGSPDLTGKSSGLSALCLNNSNISWSSSMATPPILSTPDDSCNQMIDEKSRFQVNQKILARALFSPTDNNSSIAGNGLDISAENRNDSTDTSFNNLPDSCADIFDDSFSVCKDITNKTREIEGSSFVESNCSSENELKSDEENNKLDLNIKGDCREVYESKSDLDTKKLEYPTYTGDHREKPIQSQESLLDISTDDSSSRETRGLVTNVLKGETGMLNAELNNSMSFSSPSLPSDFQACLEKRKANDSGVYSALSEFFDSPPSTAAKRRRAPLKSRKRKSTDTDEISLHITSKDDFSVSVGSSDPISLSQTIIPKDSTPITKNDDSKKKQSILLSDEKQKCSSASKKVTFAQKSMILQSDGCCFQDDVKSQSDGTFRTKRKRIKLSKKLKMKNNAQDNNENMDSVVMGTERCEINEMQISSKNTDQPGMDSACNLSDITVTNTHSLPICDKKYIDCDSSLASTFSTSVESQLQDKGTSVLTIKEKIKNSPKTPPHEDLFSQVSPSTLETMCEEPNFTRVVNANNSAEVSVSHLIGQNGEKPLVEADQCSQDLHTSRSESKIKLTARPKTSVKCIVGKPKVKRFLYPSTNQIHNVSAENVFNFKEDKKQNIIIDSSPLLEKSIDTMSSEKNPDTTLDYTDEKQKTDNLQNEGFTKFSSFRSEETTATELEAEVHLTNVKQHVETTRHQLTKDCSNEVLEGRNTISSVSEITFEPHIELDHLRDETDIGHGLGFGNKTMTLEKRPDIKLPYNNQVHHDRISPNALFNEQVNSTIGGTDLSGVLTDLAETKNMILKNRQTKNHSDDKSYDLTKQIIPHKLREQLVNDDVQKPFERECEISQYVRVPSVQHFSDKVDVPSSNQLIEHANSNVSHSLQGIVSGTSAASGFKTAKGNNIILPREKIKSGLSVFRDILSEDPDVDLSHSSLLDIEKRSLAVSGTPHKNVNDSKSFPTGRLLKNNLPNDYKLTNVEHQNVNKGEHLLKSANTNIVSPLKPSEDFCTTNLPAFQTGSGKTISVAEEKLRKMEKFFDDLSYEDDKLADVRTDERSSGLGGINVCEKTFCGDQVSDGGLGACSHQKSHLINAGFQTAGGSRISVDENKLKKMEDFLKEDLCEDKAGLFDEEGLIAHNKCKSLISGFSGSSGFQSAGGKAISVNAMKLEKAKKLLVEVTESQDITKPFDNETAQIMQEVKTVRSTKSSVSPSVSNKAKPMPMKGGNIQALPKGFRPFKPPKITPKARPKSLEKHVSIDMQPHSVMNVNSGDKMQLFDKFLSGEIDFSDGDAKSRVSKTDVDFSMDKSVCSSEQLNEKESLKPEDKEMPRCMNVTGEMSHDRSACGDAENSLFQQKSRDILNNHKQSNGASSDFQGVPCSNSLQENISKISKDCDVMDMELDMPSQIFAEYSEDDSADPENILSKGKKNHLKDGVVDNFQTTSSDVITVSTDRFRKSADLFKDDINSEIFPEEEVSLNDNGNKGMSMFQTASGNAVKVSEKSLEKCQDFFRDSVDKNIEDKLNSPPENLRTAAGCLFKTASGVDINISNESLHKSKQLFEDSFELESVEAEEIHTDQKKLNSTGSDKLHQQYSPKSTDNSKVKNISGCLFQTALGSAVNISETALKEGRKVLESSNIELEHAPSTDRVSFESITHSTDDFKVKMVRGCLFQTASGSSVNISEVALKEGRKVLEPSNIELGCAPSTDGVFLESMTNNTDDFKVKTVSGCLFQTASGSSVNISETALKEGRKVLEPSNIELGRAPLTDGMSLESMTQNTDDFKVKTVSGRLFQTASGSSVNISEAALKEGRNVLEPSNIELGYVPSTDHASVGHSSHNKDSSKIKEVGGNLFQTASGSTVRISEASLKEGRKVLEPSNLEPGCVSSTNQTTTGFLSRNTYKHSDFNKVKESSYQRTSKSTVSQVKNSVEQSSFSIKQKEDQSTDRSMNNLQAMFEDDFDMPSQIVDRPPVMRTENFRTSSNRNFYPVKIVPEGVLCDEKIRLGRQMKPLKTGETRESIQSINSSTKTEKKGCEKLSNPKKPSFVTPYKLTAKNSNTEKIETVHDGGLKKITPVFSTSYKGLSQSQINPNKLSTQCTGSNGYIPGKSGIIDRSETQISSQICVKSFKEKIEECRKIQEERITSKKRSKIMPTPGRMILEKQGCIRYSLKSLNSLRRQCWDSHNSVLSTTLRVRSKNAETFKFNLKDYFTNELTHVLIGDGAYMVPDDSGQAGKKEFYRAFLTIAGVDPKLISEEWIYNHYRWIVWKLAALELTFPSAFGGRALTPDMVMLQLKYRYDREIDHCQRSAIKKILERDDTPCKRMVLCVSGINTHLKDETNQDKKIIEQTLELTDGWYKVNAVLDPKLTDLVQKQKLTVGDKIVLSGAELTGSQDGCDPLEVPDSLTLKISANSTRPVNWDARLGYQTDPRPLCVPLSTLSAGGGTVGCVDIVLGRIYPMMYMEKIGDSTVFRTKMAEEKEQQSFQLKKQDRIEKIYNKVQAEIEDQEIKERKIKGRKKWTRKLVENLQSGEEIYSAMKNGTQPDLIQSYLSDDQINSLLSYQQKINEEKQQQLQRMVQDSLKEQEEEYPDRNVTPVMKIRIVGCARKDLDLKQSVLLTIWRPTPELYSLEEGKRYKIFSLNASASRSRHGGGDIQLTATKQTRFKQMNIDENLLDLIFEPREVQTVDDLKCSKPLFGEFDFVGMALRISHTEYADSGKTMDILYCTDSENGLLQIKFWTGLKTYCLEDVLVEGKLFCAANLLWKSYGSSLLPQAEAANDITHITLSPSNSCQRREFTKLQQLIKTFQLHGLPILFRSDGPLYWSTLSFETLITPKTLDEMTSYMDKHFHESAVEKLEHLLCRKDQSTRRDSLSESLFSINRQTDDFPESTSISRPETPGSEKKSHLHAVAQAKLSKLMSYGSPSVLSPLPSASSRKLQKPFKTPLIKSRLNLD